MSTSESDTTQAAAKPARHPKRDLRGFAIYTQFADTRGCTVTVKQSSAWGMKHCWIFCANTSGAYAGDKNANASPHLTVAQAERVAKALLRFVKQARITR